MIHHFWGNQIKCSITFGEDLSQDPFPVILTIPRAMCCHFQVFFGSDVTLSPDSDFLMFSSPAGCLSVMQAAGGWEIFCPPTNHMASLPMFKKF